MYNDYVFMLMSAFIFIKTEVKVQCNLEWNVLLVYGLLGIQFYRYRFHTDMSVHESILEHTLMALLF